jgi:hypothetical protein
MMMNWKGFGRNWLWPNLKVLSWYSPGGTVESHINLDQDSRSPEPRIEPGTTRIQSRSVNHSTTMFGGFLGPSHMLFKLIYLLLYLTSHTTYHILHAKMSFFNHCVLLGLKYLNLGNIVNPEQVRSWKFQINDPLLFIKVALYRFL